MYLRYTRGQLRTHVQPEIGDTKLAELTARSITDLVDTLVFTLWCWTHHMEPTQFSETYDNCGYWTFVVVSWLPIWALVYIAPRVL